MPEYKINYVERLLEELSEMTGHPCTFRGFNLMAEDIQEISGKYLYDNLSRASKSAKEKHEDHIDVSQHMLDKIAMHLSYKSFNDFEECCHITLREDLEGTYYSFIRKNSDLKEVLRSPATIKIKDHRMHLEFKGKDRTFKGELLINDGCATCLMTSYDERKSFYHVYKTGITISPKIISGIFTGVSSDGDPIGGRSVLVKQENSFAELSPEKLDLQDLTNHDDKIYHQLAEYFEDYGDNNLRIDKPYKLEV